MWARPVALMSVVLVWLVMTFVMMSRITASSGSVPRTSPALLELSAAAVALAPSLCPGARTSATLNLAYWPSDRLHRKLCGSR